MKEGFTISAVARKFHTTRQTVLRVKASSTAQKS
ncbi:helix-turn-helix domain-containing protein [Klebsiella aerogenes]